MKQKQHRYRNRHLAVRGLQATSVPNRASMVLTRPVADKQRGR